MAYLYLCVWGLLALQVHTSSHIEQQLLLERPAVPLNYKTSTEASSGTGYSITTSIRAPPKGTAGFVAFGDSYAGGIGTGATEWKGCRKGTNAYPALLNESHSNIVLLEDHACTGATVSDLLEEGGQIDQWLAPRLADFVTLSAGGDDLGFAVVLDACVLRYQGSRSPDCVEQLWKAISVLQTGLEAKIVELLTRILERGHSEMRVFYTGYPRFFNEKTQWCNNVTLWFWRPEHHEGGQKNGEWAYLTPARRLLLNDMVDALNSLIESAVWKVNEKYMTQDQNRRATFIDPNNIWNGHRLCDIDVDNVEVREPNPGRGDTWFFLSAWDDNSHELPGHEKDRQWNPRPATPPETGGFGEYLPIGSLAPVHGIDTCLPRFEQNRNSTEYVLCSIATATAEDPECGPNNVSRNEAFDMEMSSWDDQVQVRGVAWYWPTHWIKTFHPRSMGHDGYKKLILEAWASHRPQTAGLGGTADER